MLASAQTCGRQGEDNGNQTSTSNLRHQGTIKKIAFCMFLPPKRNVSLGENRCIHGFGALGKTDTASGAVDGPEACGLLL